MPIKDILVYVDNDRACGNRVRAASDLCNEFGAHLAGVYAERKVVVPAYAGVHIPENVFEITDKETRELREGAQSEFMECSTLNRTAPEFRVADLDVVAALNVQSRYADLVVAPQPVAERDDLNFRYDLPALLIGSASPVLMVPPQGLHDYPPRHAMLAWDGGRESARAFHAALPLLNKLDQLDIVSVGGHQIESTDLAHHAARHNLNVEVHAFDCARFDVERTLLDATVSLGSDLLVMGAYGHSRIREVILGGATHHVLHNAGLPVLFTH
ncbi:MAG: universal stress protein [Pseudomonadota bacterium]